MVGQGRSGWGEIALTVANCYLVSLSVSHFWESFDHNVPDSSCMSPGWALNSFLWVHTEGGALTHLSSTAPPSTYHTFPTTPISAVLLGVNFSFPENQIRFLQMMISWPQSLLRPKRTQMQFFFKVKVKSLSCVWLFSTPWTVAYQAPLSMGFSRQEYWSGLPFPSPHYK